MAKRLMDTLNELVPEATTHGQIIKAFRKSIEMTLSELSDQAGIIESELLEIENDRKELSLENAKKLATALGVRPVDLLFPNGRYEKDAEVLKIEKKHQKFLASKKAS